MKIEKLETCLDTTYIIDGKSFEGQPELCSIIRKLYIDFLNTNYAFDDPELAKVFYTNLLEYVIAKYPSTKNNYVNLSECEQCGSSNFHESYEYNC
jgi:hypothetical protein